jgi:hypothetical protein
MIGYKITFKRFDPFGSSQYWVHTATILAEKDSEGYYLTDYTMYEGGKNRRVHESCVISITLNL